MSAITPDVKATLPASAKKIMNAAEEQDWSVRVSFVAQGVNGRSADAWVLSLDAETTAGAVEMVLEWERGARGFRYLPKESEGSVRGVAMTDMRLPAVAELIDSAELVEPEEFGECACETDEEAAEAGRLLPLVCIVHAVTVERFDPVFGWGVAMTRNYELAGWESGDTAHVVLLPSDGNLPERLSFYFAGPVTAGQEPLTLAEVVPVEVRTAERVEGRPVYQFAAECGERGCEVIGRVYRVPGLSIGDRCAEHAAAAAGCPVSALDTPAFTEDDRSYVAELIEDRRRDKVFTLADDWAGVQEWEERRSVPVAYSDWVRDTYTGDPADLDPAAQFVAWLMATGNATDDRYAWAMTAELTPADVADQARIRLDTARTALEEAKARRASAQRWGTRLSMDAADLRYWEALGRVEGAEREYAEALDVAGLTEEQQREQAAAGALRGVLTVVAVEQEVERVVEESAAGSDDLLTAEVDRVAASARPEAGGGAQPSPEAVAAVEKRVAAQLGHQTTEEQRRAVWRIAGDGKREQRRREAGPDPEFPADLVDGERVAPMSPGWGQEWWLLREVHGFGFEINHRRGGRWWVMERTREATDVPGGVPLPRELADLGTFGSVEEALDALREHGRRRAEGEAGTRLVERIRRLAAEPTVYSVAEVERPGSLPAVAPAAPTPGAGRTPASTGGTRDPQRPAGPLPAPGGDVERDGVGEDVERVIGAAVERVAEVVRGRVERALAGVAHRSPGAIEEAVEGVLAELGRGRRRACRGARAGAPGRRGAARRRGAREHCRA
ncbi:hypothetical protein ABZW10_32860 [Kitasatospora sp. NPDC004723]|uniref:hypothetical protein n=1 Tax=Kitasatospora sp. NPDC004723 TaxID=3154288 RepID=UPI0033BEDD97